MSRSCPNCFVELRKILTKQGVEIDACAKCDGIWLDAGEVYHFTSEPQVLQRALEDAMSRCQPSAKASPVTGQPMREFSLANERLKIDVCPKSGGLWFDAGELQAMMKIGPAAFRLTPAAPASPAPAAAVPGLALLALPNLAVRSLAVLVSLYAILALALIMLSLVDVLSATGALIVGVVFAILQFALSPFLMDLSLRWFYRLQWVAPENLPAALRNFAQNLCQQQGMALPRFGIIDDGAPNAFTYGHTPQNARVVITRGLMNILSEDELKAVVAHEIGHARRWDILIMTVASLVPLILYYIYRTFSRVRSRKQNGGRIIAMVVAYLLYIAAQYLVLWLSRTREYHADRFAGDATGDPALLASALVKIGYGLAGQKVDEPLDSIDLEEEAPRRRSRQRQPAMEAVGALGIFDRSAAQTLAITAGSAVGTVDRDLIKKAARWDLWNPWAWWYEAHSTHPRIAKRLEHLSNQAQAMGKAPYILFDEPRPESFWDEFLADVAVAALPTLAVIFGVILFAATRSVFVGGAAVFLLGCAMLVKTLMIYRDYGFPQHTVASLLASVKVSAVRPIPCSLQGRVIGKGVPGLIWSEDFILQDKTGIIFLDYRQPLRIWEWFFGLMRAGEYQNQEVKVTGWYRRGPTPYVELRTLEAGGVSRRCYVYQVKIAFALLVEAVGLILAFSTLL